VSREDWSALEELTMHRTARLLHPPHEEVLADALLGADHPLVRVLRRRAELLEQSRVVAAVLAASIVALADGLSASLALVIAAAIFESALACDAAMQSCRKRDGVLELIVQGRGDLPLPAIACERRRLLDHGHQQHLAGWLDAIRNEDEHPVRVRRAPPICSVRVIAAAAPDLATIAELLRSEDAGLRGVAATQRLLVDGTSSLYGHDENRLREELHRIRFLLGS
jgi:hypothetical protein